MTECETMSGRTHTNLDVDVLAFLQWRLSEERPWVHRSEIVTEFEYPRTTVYDSLEKLEIQGLVVREKRSDGSRGRPKTFWRAVLD